MTTPLNRYWRYIQCSLHFVNSHRGGLDFTLPPIKARHVGLAESDAVPAKPDTQIYIAVLDGAADGVVVAGIAFVSDGDH